MQAWIGQARFLQLLRLLVLLYLAGNTRAFAVDVTLSWDPNSEPAVAGYNLHYGTAARTYSETIVVGDKTSYTVTGLGGGTYFFAVTAYDILGNESSYSNEVSQTASPAGCTYSISPLSQSFASAGGTGSAAVSSSTGCSWPAASNAGWITITSGGSGGGNGTVTYTVETNSSTSSRTGTMTIAGQTFTVTQAGSVPPTTSSFDLRVTSASVGSVSLAWNKATDPAAVNYNLYRGTASGNYETYADLNVATTSYTFTGLTPGVTYYFAISYDTWTAGESDYSDEVSQTVPAVVSQTMSAEVSQTAPAACLYSISSLGRSYGSAGGTGRATVASSTGCGWGAASDASWMTITAGGSERGNGTVAYTVEANKSASSRTAALTIAGQSFRVTQASSQSEICTYNISPASHSFPNTGGSGTLSISCRSGYSWTVSGAPEWININSAGSGTGDGAVTFSLERNSGKHRRRGELTVAGQTLVVEQAGRNKTAFPQVANGAQWVSSIVLTNPSATETVTGSLNLLNDGGQPLLVSLNNQPPAETVSFAISPLGGATFTTDGAGDLVSGSAQVSSDNPVSGVVKYSHPAFGMAGVGESHPLRSLMTPVLCDRNRGLNTAVALHNTSDSPVEMRLSLRGLDGREVARGSSSAVLPAGGHVAKFIDELFPGVDASSFQGTLVVRSSGLEQSVTATTIQTGGSVGEFTTLPVIPLDPAPAPRELFFAQLAAGADWTSVLFLTNPKGTASNNQLAFYDDEGRPLPISVNAHPAAPGVSSNIQPQGAVTLSAGGNGSLVSGSARVHASGAVGGVLSLTSPGLGVAGVGASIPSDGFIAPVTRSATESSSTGVAIASTGLPVKVTLTLRDEKGKPVSGGGATLELSANGHLARYLEQLFPDADTREFRGAVTATAEGGSIVGAVLEFHSKAGQITALPVIPLQ